MITVVGSINMDLVVSAPRIPAVGETITGTDFRENPGGKGANQAVAAARLGSRVAFVGCLGLDSFGDRLQAGLEEAGEDHPIRGDHGHIHAFPEQCAGDELLLRQWRRGWSQSAIALGERHRMVVSPCDAPDRRSLLASDVSNPSLLGKKKASFLSWLSFDSMMIRTLRLPL